MSLFSSKHASAGGRSRRLAPRALVPVFFAVTLLLLPLLFSCGGGSVFGGRIAVSDTRFALGSFLQIVLVTDKSGSEKAKRTLEKAFEMVKGYEALFDYRREGGALFKFNSGTTLLKSEEEKLFSLVQEALAAAEYTGGYFDPTVLPIVRLWGFDSDSPHLPKRQDITAALKRVGYKKVDVRGDRIVKPREVEIDLSGIAQGKTVDLVRGYFTREGYRDFLINASGDIYASGRNVKRRKWRVAIQDPVRQDRYSGIVEKSDIAIVTSGDYERFFTEGGVRYCHLMNPFTGYPQSDLKSVTILSSDATTADSLSTAVFVMGSVKGLEFLLRNGIEGYLVYSSGGKVESKSTPGFWK